MFINNNKLTIIFFALMIKSLREGLTIHGLLLKNKYFVAEEILKLNNATKLKIQSS